MCSIFLLINSREFIITIVVSMLHEIGHIISMLVCKRNISFVKVNAFSVDIVQQDSFLPYSKELFILISGPILNIIFYVIFQAIYSIIRIEILESFAVQNLLIGIMNLLPVSSLDGGQILSIILKKFFDDEKSYRISCLISVMFIIPLISLGFYLFLKSFNISIFILMIYLSSFLIIRN